jgi:acetate---CoA ligase (ADP-forming)
MSVGEQSQPPERMVHPAAVRQRPALRAMLEARSVALVGASPRPGSFGQRMIDEVARSPAGPDIYLVNPRYRQIGERPCHPSLADLPGPADLVLLGVPDAALERQLGLAASRGDGAAVIFGNAHEDPLPAPADGSSGRAGRPGSAPARAPGEPGRPGLRERLASIARAAGMELCGAGCMGFVNVARGLRAIGYVEPDQLPSGPAALVTHSGSVFSAMLRSHRAIGFTLAVSSGQELVTTAAAYLEYALSLPETRVLALVLEAMREPDRLRAVLASAAARDIPVVLLTVGSSARGQAMVAAHSGALAARDGGWEALADAYGVHRVGDLAELADTLELFAIGRRVRPPGPPGPSGLPGIATVHDSGLERAHAADLADELGVPFAAIGEPTLARLGAVLDPGLQPANPLDIWGTGTDAQRQLSDALAALADDPAVAAVALAVDLIREFDGDRSYPGAVLDAAGRTAKPLAVLASLASAIDRDAAAELRQAGIPVLEGMRTGLLALRHLLDHAAVTTAAADPGAAPPGTAPLAATSLGATSQFGAERRERAVALLAAGQAAGAPLLSLLREYGIATARSDPAADIDAALAAASAIGYPVVLKTGEPGIAHKTDARGVLLGIRDPAELAAAYQDLSARLGPRAVVCETIASGIEIALGIARDADLGPLIVVGAGGILVELLADRVVALPPVSEEQARRMIGRLRAGRLLAGIRGGPPADSAAVVRAITGLSALAIDLGDELEALDVNPLICGPAGAVAVDVLAVARTRQP